MSNTPDPKIDSAQPVIYQIRIKGHWILNGPTGLAA